MLTYGDSDWAGDADRFSVSGTAAWVQGKLGWYPITTSSKKQSTIALSCGEADWLLHYLALVQAWAFQEFGEVSAASFAASLAASLPHLLPHLLPISFTASSPHPLPHLLPLRCRILCRIFCRFVAASLPRFCRIFQVIFSPARIFRRIFPARTFRVGVR